MFPVTNSEPAGCLTTATGSNQANLFRRSTMANSRLCSIPGCGKPHHSNNYCRNHNARRRDHGDPLGGKAAPGEPMNWIIAHQNHQGDECLIWPYARTDKGYAKYQNRGAYQVMCEIAHGPRPSPEHESAHSCGKGPFACVHPQHLRWATRQENQSDRVEHGTLPVGEEWYNARLTSAEIAEIRNLGGQMRQVDIANMFGTSQSHVGRILRRQVRASG